MPGTAKRPKAMNPAATTPAAVAGASRAATYAAIAVGLGTFAIYAALCPPVSGMGDGSEFTLVLAQLGVAHPTGYPLYTIFGHLFAAALHAAGVSWPLAANLWSAVGAGIAMGSLFAVSNRLARTVPGAGVGACLVAALIPVLLFAFQPILLPDASAGEVNSWSVAWACIAAFAFVSLQAEIESGPRGVRRGALIWGLVCGAGLAHHATSVLIALPLTIALVVTLVRLRRPLVTPMLVAAAAACLPLASYAFIAWRAWHPVIEQWPSLMPSLASVWEHISGAQYRHYLGYFAPAHDQAALIAQIALPFLGVGIVALLAGIARSGGAATRTIWLALAAASLLGAGFTFRYGVPDPAPYFLPAMAIGAAAVAPALVVMAAPRVRGAAVRLGLGAMATLLLVVPWLKDGQVHRLEILGYEELVRSMWSAVPPDTAIVFWPDDRFIRLREYQLLRGEKPALLVLCPDLLTEDRTRRKLRERFGVDPLDGYPPPEIVPGNPDEALQIRRYFKQVIRGLNDRVPVPVILFDPSIPIVQRQRKPWERAAEAAPPGMPSGHPALP